MCSRCSVLVCWTGQVNFQKKCIELVRQLWDNDVRAEILYDSLQVYSGAYCRYMLTVCLYSMCVF